MHQTLKTGLLLMLLTWTAPAWSLTPVPDWQTNHPVDVPPIIKPVNPIEPPPTSGQHEADITVTGTLVPTVESGGWTVTADGSGQKYLLLGAKPESWFKEGLQVEVTGEPSKNTITIYMEGIPFRVKSISPVNPRIDEIP